MYRCLGCTLHKGQAEAVSAQSDALKILSQRHCRELNGIPASPNPCPLRTQNVALFGNWVLADVKDLKIKLSWI